VPVLQEPEFVDAVQAEKPEGVMMFRRSKMAGPPPIVKFTVLKAVIGNEVPISLMVPVVPKIGSVPETSIAVVPLQVAGTPENAIQAGMLETATRSPLTLLTLTMPPPPNGMGVANDGTTAMVVTARNAPARVKDFKFMYSSPY